MTTNWLVYLLSTYAGIAVLVWPRMYIGVYRDTYSCPWTGFDRIMCSLAATIFATLWLPVALVYYTRKTTTALLVRLEEKA